MAKGLVSPNAPSTRRQITIKSHLSEHFIDARMLICRIVKSLGEWHLLEGYCANFKIEPHAHAARREKNCEIVLERARHISLFMAGRAPLLRAIRSEDSGLNPFAHAIRPVWMRREGGRQFFQTIDHTGWSMWSDSRVRLTFYSAFPPSASFCLMRKWARWWNISDQSQLNHPTRGIPCICTALRFEKAKRWGWSPILMQPKQRMAFCMEQWALSWGETPMAGNAL